MTINNPYTSKNIIVEPLTYLTLMLTKNQEQTSNAAGYIDARKKCIKLTKKQIKDGFKPAAGTECDTETYGKQLVQINQPTVETYEEWIKNNPQIAQSNETLKKEVDKAGGWQKFWANFSTWSKTEKGQGILNSVGMLAGGLLGKQETTDVNKKDYLPQESSGMNPIWWVLIGIGGLALLGGLGFGIYKLFVKKSASNINTVQTALK